jgi:protein-disulfide isomerase
LPAVKHYAIAAALFLAAGAAAGQGITQQQADEILNELRAIRQTLERQQAPAQRPAQAPADENVSIAFASGGHSIGRADAPLVMVEYTDYQCPFCRQFHIATFDEIKRNYVDTGRVRYVSRDFPLDFHENARRAAIAARCAGEQGKFWELRHVMIVNASQLKAENIVGYAKDLNLAMPPFRECFESERHRPAVDRDMAEGQSAGVSGTPSFLLGKVVNGRLQGVRVVGAQPYQAFAGRLDEMLKPAR